MILPNVYSSGPSTTPMDTASAAVHGSPADHRPGPRLSTMRTPALSRTAGPAPPPGRSAAQPEASAAAAASAASARTGAGMTVWQAVRRFAARVTGGRAARVDRRIMLAPPVGSARDADGARLLSR